MHNWIGTLSTGSGHCEWHSLTTLQRPKVIVLPRTRSALLCICQILITLRAKLSGAVYCNRSCLCVRLFVCGFVFVCLWVCYHDNSKLRSSIFTKLGLRVKVVTISSWLNFGRPAPLGRGSAAERKFLAPPCVVLASPLSDFSFRNLFASGFTSVTK